MTMTACEVIIHPNSRRCKDFSNHALPVPRHPANQRRLWWKILLRTGNSSHWIQSHAI